MIQNPYTYRDYRLLIADDFLSRSAANPGYSLRAYARDLDLSPAYLSFFLKGKKHLGLKTSTSVFARIGMTSDEIDYLKNLVISVTAKRTSDRTEALNAIEQSYQGPRYTDKPEKDYFLKSLEHFLVYGLARAGFTKKELENKFSALGLAASVASKAANELIKHRYLQLEPDGSLSVVSRPDVIQMNPKILPILASFSEFLAFQVRKSPSLHVPKRVAHALILKFDQNSFEMAVAAHKHFIQQLHRLAEDATSAAKNVLYSDTFWTIEEPSEEPMDEPIKEP